MRSRIFAALLTIALIGLGVTVSLAQQAGTTENLLKSFDEQVKEAPCDSSKRKDAVIELFKSMGAPADAIRTEKFDRGENILIAKPGKNAETIYVGAHYDKVDDGCGAIDNWTGIVIIANLYKAFASVPTDKTHVFVAFDAEEKGLFGSIFMAKSLKKQQSVTSCSMLNFDSFGFAAPQAPGDMASKEMLREARQAAKELEFTLYTDAIPNADSDSSSFVNAGIPAITFDGLNAVSEKYLHNTNDRATGIRAESLVMGYTLGVRLLSQLDAKPCGLRSTRKN